MLISVGSKNRSKLNGVERAYSLFLKDFQVVGVEVPSEITPQPMNLETTFRGALIRAEKSLELVRGAEHGVGVEAGLFRLLDAWFDIHVAVVVDNQGIATYGLSSAFEIPPTFAEKLVGGSVKELELLVDDYFKTKDVGEHGGFIKLLTRGKVLRDDLVFQSVLMALVPRMNKDLYFPQRSSNA